jgi:hypothetical protein
MKSNKTLLLIAAAAVAVWYFFLRKPAAVNTQSRTEGPPAGNPIMEGIASLGRMIAPDVFRTNGGVAVVNASGQGNSSTVAETAVKAAPSLINLISDIFSPARAEAPVARQGYDSPIGPQQPTAANPVARQGYDAPIGPEQPLIVDDTQWWTDWLDYGLGAYGDDWAIA